MPLLASEHLNEEIAYFSEDFRCLFGTGVLEKVSSLLSALLGVAFSAIV